MMAPRRPAHGWGLGLVAAAHAALLAVAWAQSLALDPAGTRPPAVLVAQLLALAGPPPEPPPEPPALRPALRPAAQPPAAPALAVPELPRAEALRAETTRPLDGAAARPATPAPADTGNAPAPAPDTAPTLALASVQPTAAAPAAPRRTPAGHAGCADVPHPLALRERGIEGLVHLRVQVGSDGRARQVQLLGSSGWRLFDEAALAKARSCRFRPAFEGDTAVESWVEFPVRFALTQS